MKNLSIYLKEFGVFLKATFIEHSNYFNDFLTNMVSVILMGNILRTFSPKAREMSLTEESNIKLCKII